LSQDGFWFYDGNNAFKISDRISDTLGGYNLQLYTETRGTTYKKKNQVWWSMTDSGDSENSVTVMWDYFNNAWSLWTGMAPSYLATFYVAGNEERPYWADYAGYTYRGDTGDSDYPLNSETAIDSYYYTNWKHFQDIIEKKAVPLVKIYYQIESTTLTFAYSYDFESGDEYSNSFSLDTSQALWDSMVWDEDEWGGSGGKVIRQDLTGRGDVVRFKFANSTKGEPFRIDGFGMYPHLETKV